MAQKELNSPFTIQDAFYRAVDPTRHVKRNNNFKPGAFKPRENEELSVDWAAKTYPMESARRQAHRWDFKPTPVAQVGANLVTELELNVRYVPIPDNDAHSEIYGSLLHDGRPEGTLARQRLANECTNLGPFDITPP